MPLGSSICKFLLKGILEMRWSSGGGRGYLNVPLTWGGHKGSKKVGSLLGEVNSRSIASQGKKST